MTSSSEFADRPHPNPSPEGEGLSRRRVTLAAVAGAHGLAGDVRLKLFTADVEGLRRYESFDADGRALTLKSVRAAPGGAVARFAEIPDRTAAEALRGKALTVPRDALPPLDDGEYYHADLIGLPVTTPQDDVIGMVDAIENFGAGDLLSIVSEDGRSFLAPMHAASICSTHVILDPIYIQR